MRVSLALLFCLAGAVPAVAVADEVKLPAAMQRALDRISRGEVGPAVTSAPELLLKPAAPKTCSVPLVEVPVDRPERFTIRQGAPKNFVDTMPRAQMPALPCDSKNP